MPTPNRLEHLEHLEKRVLSANTSEGRMHAHARLGHHRSGLGFATAGLRELLIACGALAEGDAFDQGKLGEALDQVTSGKLPNGEGDPAVLANLAEALRVYARDVLLSRAQDAALNKTIEASVNYFKRALELVQRGAGVNPEINAEEGKRAWLLAHHAAALMMKYWLGLVTAPKAGEKAAGDDEIFNACDLGFKEACELQERYTWAIQFRAFLYALRGRGRDFRKAEDLLQSLDEKALSKPTIQRSIAMLRSYNAACPPDGWRGSPDGSDAEGAQAAREEAARASIAAAMNAQRDDEDEFLGPYSCAVSSWALYDMALKANMADEETTGRRRDAQAAVETAEIRARNSISQALVALVGLTFIKGRLAAAAQERAQRQKDQEKDPAKQESASRALAAASKALADAYEESKNLQELILKAKFRDLESISMVIRDPVWQAMLKDKQCYDGFCKPGFDELRVLRPSNPNDKIQQAI